MNLMITRSFPPSIGGMQNLMWGLANELAKIDILKVFADFELNHIIADNYMKKYFTCHCYFDKL